jgi:Family of unknown function (DUF5995)
MALTTDDVIADLTRIVDRARLEQDRLGYFAALYRRVTQKVKDDIAAGLFEDGPRMEAFDVIFANRYLAALEQFQAGGRPSRSWAVAFEVARKKKPLILQQLLLGMSAHINLDLGAAAAQVAPGGALPALKNDFYRINSILASLIDIVEGEIDELSPALGWLDHIGGRNDEAVINFSILRARDSAWDLAQKLALLPAAQAEVALAQQDSAIAWLGRKIERPGWLVRLGVLWIRGRESNDVAHNITVLARDFRV